ncbi:MAG: hypothetical protein WC052_04490 [Patescibacteria group bacterium]
MADFWINSPVQHWALGRKPVLSAAAVKQMFNAIPASTWTEVRINTLIGYIARDPCTEMQDKNFRLIMLHIPVILRTEKLWLNAIAQNVRWIDLVPNMLLVEEFLVKVMRLTKGCGLDHIPDSLKSYGVCCAAIKHAIFPSTAFSRYNPLRAVPQLHQTTELLLLAMDAPNWSYRHFDVIENQTTEMCVAIVTKNPKAISYLREQSREACLVALSTPYGSHRIYDIREQTDELCLAALTAAALHRTGIDEVLVNIRNHTPDICYAAYTLDNTVFDRIRGKRNQQYVARCAYAELIVLPLRDVNLSTNLLVAVCELLTPALFLNVKPWAPPLSPLQIWVIVTHSRLFAG